MKTKILLLLTSMLCWISAGCDTDNDKDANGGTDTAMPAKSDGGIDAAIPIATDTIMDTGTGALSMPWDWHGVVGTGQSLAVGEKGTPYGSREQPYNNLKMSTGSLDWPVDPNDPTLVMEPLVEPIGRRSRSYPSSWPENIAGETPHSAMANQVTALVKTQTGFDYVGVHGEFGENGQCMKYLKKNAEQTEVNGRAFEATLIETRAVKRLAEAEGKTYGVGAIIVTHGECDAGTPTYAADLHQLWSDYNADIKAITGQTESIWMIVSQQNSINDRSASTLAQWQAGIEYPDAIVCMGPKYQFPYNGDGIHLETEGYQQLGEKYAQVYVERVVFGRRWQPLQPISATREGRVITVAFHVPVPPLVFDTTLPAPNQSSLPWKSGQGFEVRKSGNDVTIESVAIDGNTVKITCATELTGAVTVGYAVTATSDDPMAVIDPANPNNVLFSGTTRWGRLRDSDPFVGTITGKPNPNWSVAFEMDVL